MRHINQNIPMYNPKKKVSEDPYANVEHLVKPRIPHYILENYKYNREIKNNEM